MATGIVSIAEATFGRSVTSTALLAIAAAGYAVLVVAFLLRAAWFGSEIWADTARPHRAFGFFTFVAASNVLGLRLAMAGQETAAAALGMAGAIAWLLLSYGILARVALAGTKPAPSEAVDGTWLIWVVATQSVSISLSVSGGAVGLPARAAALAATSLWAFGALLYVLLMAIVLARLIVVPLVPGQATPPYWISMGATAITVLAGAHLLRLSTSLPSIAAARSTVEGFTLFLWAFGTWWIPFLVLLTAWRYRARSTRVYEAALWSMVFPLGMYSVATDTFGRAASLPLLPPIAEVEIWFALATWVAVAVWGTLTWALPGRLRPAARPSPSARG